MGTYPPFTCIVSWYYRQKKRKNSKKLEFHPTLSSLKVILLCCWNLLGEKDQPLRGFPFLWSADFTSSDVIIVIFIRATHANQILAKLNSVILCDWNTEPLRHWSLLVRPFDPGEGFKALDPMMAVLMM